MLGGKFGFGRKPCKLVIGKHNNVPDWKFNQHELALGIKTELEHTNDYQTAKNIARDHLMEKRDYYTRLIKAGL
jgi:hypothetical protein